MALPRVKIEFTNGALGSVSPSADCVVGMVITGVAVDTTLELLKPYILYQLEDLIDLGVTSEENDNNKFLYKTIKEFYDQNSKGAELWLMVVPNTVTQADMLDKTKNYAKSLIQQANGRLRCISVAYNPASGYTPTVENGLDSNVFTAISNAQALCEWATTTLYAPLFAVIEGMEYKKANITELKDLTEMSNNRVGVLIGDSISESNGAAIGILTGKIASCSVQKHIGRVKDGALNADDIYIDNENPHIADIETLNNKGYITFRTFTGKSGYFFTDDSLATAVKDDYRSIARRRTIDKAYRIVYQTMINHINDEIPVRDDGCLVPSMCEGWQKEIINNIYDEMTLNSELGVDSTDDTDKGVKCNIDYKQKVLATNKIQVNVQIKPYGYSKYIDVNLGFIVTNS
jgi:hypothetical protein